MCGRGVENPEVEIHRCRGVDDYGVTTNREYDGMWGGRGKINQGHIYLGVFLIGFSSY